MDQRQSNTSRKSVTKSKPSLKLIGKAPPTKLHLGASPASDEVRPGEYLVRCTNAWLEPWRGASRCVWQFEICDGPHHGVGVRKWKKFSLDGEVSQSSEFARACAIALERPLEHSDDLNNPAAIFAGKKFLVFIGYRKTPDERGGQASDELALQKKGPDDKLKVHDIRSLVKL